MSPSTDVIRSNEAGITNRTDFGGSEVERSAETARNAVMAHAKALIESRFVMAMRKPRNWMDVRAAINRLTDDPDFAAQAEYCKPLGYVPDGWGQMSKREQLLNAPDNWPRGLSVRFVEAVLYEAGNFDSSSFVMFEDDSKRMTQVSVLDLQNNGGYSTTIVTPKFVERKKPAKGQEVISGRTNSQGETVYLVVARPDEVTMMEAAAKSKALRTLGEKLLPPQLKAEWRRRCDATILNEAAKDPQGERKKLLDAFSERGIMPSALESYFGHSVETIQPSEIVDLRKIYTGLSSGEWTWQEVVEAKFGSAAADQEKKAEPSKAAAALREKLAKKETPKPAATAQQAPAAKPVADWPDVVAAYGGEDKAIRALASRGFESWPVSPRS